MHLVHRKALSIVCLSFDRPLSAIAVSFLFQLEQIVLLFDLISLLFLPLLLFSSNACLFLAPHNLQIFASSANHCISLRSRCLRAFRSLTELYAPSEVCSPSFSIDKGSLLSSYCAKLEVDVVALERTFRSTSLTLIGHMPVDFYELWITFGVSDIVMVLPMRPALLSRSSARPSVRADHLFANVI